MGRREERREGIRKEGGERGGRGLGRREEREEGGDWEGGRRERREEGGDWEGGREVDRGRGGERQGQGMKPASRQLNATSGHMSDSPEDHKQKPHKGPEGPPWTCS